MVKSKYEEELEYWRNQITISRTEFLKTLPGLIVELVERARKYYFSVTIELNANGPVVTFKYENAEEREHFLGTLTYQSDEYEYKRVVDGVDHIKQLLDGKHARKLLAQAAFETLTPFERKAIREHIDYLRD
jgi:hypothetical protein